MVALTAQEKRVPDRIQDYGKICHQTDLPKQAQLNFSTKAKDVTARFDHVFWCGDLNFRLMNDRSVVGLLKDDHENKQLAYENLLKFDRPRSAVLHAHDCRQACSKDTPI
ncbi:inositol polyphosphate 5-phosphatase E-like isoform X2 [Rhipicephalus microplus]|uniref:inositol polyphosphate 5-phosphatase E-like isoform X2 n=1 Tax=Rhipicephalus microplus TaxID=6941 RepID=UPI003F6BD15E